MADVLIFVASETLAGIGVVLIIAVVLRTQDTPPTAAAPAADAA